MDIREAVKFAVHDAGVKVITYVPGYPITEIAEAIKAEISVNEKVAMEIALGASATGSRSMVVVKQLGMNLLADPMVISTSHTIGSGIVALAGDDLGPRGSQSEMDSRYYGPLSGLPVLDPRDPASMYQSLLEAYVLSEKIRAPVVVRTTSLLNRSSGPQPERRVLEARELKFDRSIWDLTARGRQQRYRRESFPLAEDASENTCLNKLKIPDGLELSDGSKTEIIRDMGMIALGRPAKLAEGLDVPLLTLGYAHPLPWNLVGKFLETHGRVVVAEEPWPFIESQLRARDNILGRFTGHLPYGPLQASDIKRALEMVQAHDEDYETSADKGHRSICDDCPFAGLYEALGRVDVPVAGDAGCSIRAVRAPYDSVDMVYGLGSSVGVASGFRSKGIAVIGDYALAHSGLQGLINAVWQRRDLLLVLIQNGIAAQTGGQAAPDLAKILRAMVPLRLVQLPSPVEAIEKALREELKKPGISAIIAQGVCPRLGS